MPPGWRLFHVCRSTRKSLFFEVPYRYLFYALTLRHSEIAFDWVKKAHPSVIRKLYADIPLPPLPEQQRIVALLDEAFAGLATAKANAERNLQNARAIFESQLQFVFTQRGEGWVESTIGETCTLKSGTTVSPTLEHPDGDLPYLKVADMSFEGNEDQITSSSRFLLMTDIKESAVIPKGATIFPKRGGAIMTNKKRIAALPICADLNIMSVIPSQRLRAQLLYYYFLNVDMRKLGTGSSIPQINNYDVEPLTISFPESLATQEELIRAFDELREETQRLTRIYERKLSALEELKKSLLHQAFNGEL
jgi:type I restriction enzyme S subunit